MVVRLNRNALITASKEPQSAIGVEGDQPLESSSASSDTNTKRVSEASKIVSDAKRKVDLEGGSSVGVSGSNSGKGHDQQPLSPSSESAGSNATPLSPNANPLAASTSTGEIPVLNQPPPPKNLNLQNAGDKERKSDEKERDNELERVKEEEEADEVHDSKEVNLKGGEAASPETKKNLSLPHGAEAGDS